MSLLGKTTNCDRVGELLSPYIDGQISAGERRFVEEHLASCEQCAAALEQLRWTVQALHEIPALSLPRSFVLASHPGISEHTELPAFGTGPVSILPYLRRATLGLAAVFVLLFATSVYLKAAAGPMQAPFFTAPQQQKMLTSAPSSAADNTGKTAQVPKEAAPAAKAVAPAVAPNGAQPTAQAAAPAAIPTPGSARALGALPAAPAANPPAAGGAASNAESTAQDKTAASSATDGGQKQLERAADTAASKRLEQPNGEPLLPSLERNEAGIPSYEESPVQAGRVQESIYWPLWQVEVAVLAMLLILGLAIVAIRRFARG